MSMKLIFAVLILMVPPGAYATGQNASAVNLLYHHVSDRTPAITSISPDKFNDHLTYLSENNFHILPLAEVVSSLQSGKPLPDRSITISFDDAYLSIYTTAFPLLKARGFPFTIFVATNLIGTNPNLYLNWEQIKEMVDQGVTIANHTQSHLHLLRRVEGESKTQWLSRITNEIKAAQKIIESNIGETPLLFAYPYGEYDRDILNLVQQLGYSGFGQQSGAMGSQSDFLTLPRFPLAGIYTGLDSFKTKVNTLPLPIQPINIDTLVTTDDLQPAILLQFQKKVPELSTPKLLGLRLSELRCYGPGGKMMIEQQDAVTFRVTPVAEIPVGRSRYNCTMPSNQAGRYFWYSQPWIRKNNDGSWYPEP